MCTYFFVYRYIYIYTYIYTHVYTYIYIHTHTHIYIYIFIYLFIYVFSMYYAVFLPLREVESRSKPGAYFYAHPATKRTQLEHPGKTRRIPLNPKP